jgi:uncharacterized protein YkwD
MHRIAMVAALAMAALFSGFTSLAKACRGADKSPAGQTVEDARRAMTCLVNRRRARAGRHPVRPSVALGIAAQGHSQAMAANDFFGHGGDGTASSRAAAAGYGGRTVGENLGWGHGYVGSPRWILNTWMASPSHRQVILRPRFRQIGVGIATGSPFGPDSPNTATYTINLGRR